MPEHIQALIVISVATFTTFGLLRKFALPYTTSVDFNVWRNAILFITAFLFLSSNFWLFLGLTFLYTIYLKNKIKAPALLFCILLFVAPIHMTKALGGINFEFNYVRLIALAILLPAFLKIHRDPRRLRLGKHKADMFLLAYLFIYFICDIRGTTFTDGLRHLLYMAVDIFLPYYILSRTIKTIEEINAVIFALFTAILVCGNIGIFEHINQWLVYEMLNNIFATLGSSGYMGRGNDLRAVSSTGFPIVLGYIMTVALGLFIYLKETEVKLSKITVILAFAMVAGGLYAPVSRGPWVGAAILCIIFILINKNTIKNLLKVKLLAACVAVALAGTPLGDKLFNLLPFVGETEKHNVEYRERLFDVTMVIIERYPILGSYNFLNEPEMTKLYQGNVSNSELKVDIVNSYIGIALAQGLVGLILFLGIFGAVLVSLTKSIRRAKKLPANYRLLGTTLFAIIISIMVMITTVSSIVIIPVVNFAILGLAVAYTNIVNNKLKAEPEQQVPI
jgi:O-antigen ligase